MQSALVFAASTTMVPRQHPAAHTHTNPRARTRRFWCAPGSRNGVPQIDEEGLRRLFTQQLDFLGISAYAPYNIAGRDLALREFENSAFMLCDEMLSGTGRRCLGVCIDAA